MAPGNAGSFFEHVAVGVRIDIAGGMVNHVLLLNIGCRANDLGPGALEGEEREDSFMDLGAVVDSTTGEDDCYLLHRRTPWGKFAICQLSFGKGSGGRGREGTHPGLRWCGGNLSLRRRPDRG